VEEVQRLLAERDAQWEDRMNSLTAAIMMLGQKTEEQKPAPTWDFVPSYGENGEIINLRAMPTNQA
jgi:hypothetical protein